MYIDAKFYLCTMFPVLPVVPNTKDKEESAKFVKEFIRFCLSLENAAHQP